MQKKLSVSKGDKQHNPILSFIYFIAVIVLVAEICNIITGFTYLELSNIKVIVTTSVYPTIIAWGLCFLFAAGYYDLSIGSVIVLGSFATCAFGNIYGYPGVILGGLIAGTLLIMINSVIFVYIKVPTWIASLCLTLIYEAVAIFLRQYKPTLKYVDAELDKGLRMFGKIPVNLYLIAACFIIIYLLYNRTSIGLNIRAIGGSKEVSASLGVNTRKTLLLTGLICGIIIGIASIVQESYNVRTPVMTSMTSLQMMFKPLAIALLAQTLQNRINIIIAVPFCSVVIYGVFNLMTFFGAPSGTLQEVFLCVFIIAFGMIGQRGVKEVVK